MKRKEEAALSTELISTAWMRYLEYWLVRLEREYMDVGKAQRAV